MNDPEQIDCHDCGAKPGDPCRTFEGAARRPHPIRIRDSREEFA